MVPRPDRSEVRRPWIDAALHGASSMDRDGWLLAPGSRSQWNVRQPAPVRSGQRGAFACDTLVRRRLPDLRKTGPASARQNAIGELSEMRPGALRSAPRPKLCTARSTIVAASPLKRNALEEKIVPASLLARLFPDLVGDFACVEEQISQIVCTIMLFEELD